VIDATSPVYHRRSPPGKHKTHPANSRLAS
jgi:hypothetical protein